MKTVSRDDVRTVAAALIVLNGSTTTLDVKNALRNKGFWVKQEDIRNYMLDITSQDGDIQYKDTGLGYRSYHLKSAANLNQHTIDPVTFICTSCGRSQGAISHFGWDVCSKSVAGNGSQPGSPIVGTATMASTAPVVTRSHRHDAQDNVPADYRVTDDYGRFSMQFFSVTRAQAKASWAKAIGKSYSLARTKKV